MKKVLLFLILAFFFVINSRAQSIVDTNKVWYNIERGDDGTYKTSIFFFKGDTIFDGLKYKKVITSDSSQTIFDYPIAAREDTTNKQVFFYYPGQEYLVYDFSLKVDSFFVAYNDGCVVQYIVESIDSITLLNGEKRKRITLVGPSQTEHWIVGIGSDLGLFRMGMYFCDHEFRISRLNCFKENDTLKYHNPNYPNCYFTDVGIQEILSNNPISISPNPFTTSTQITLPQTYHNIALAVYDIQGKLLVQNQYKDCSQIQFNRNQLSNGLYFLKLTLDDKAMETGKIVVDAP
jgi:hypothetical protein